MPVAPPVMRIDFPIKRISRHLTLGCGRVRGLSRPPPISPAPPWPSFAGKSDSKLIERPIKRLYLERKRKAKVGLLEQEVFPRASEFMVPTSESFDPRHFSRVRRPLPEASHLPAWCYTSGEFYGRETERVFRKCWNFLGRADRVPNPGDYFTAEIAGVPLIVLRDRAG